MSQDDDAMCSTSSKGNNSNNTKEAADEAGVVIVEQKEDEKKEEVPKEEDEAAIAAKKKKYENWPFRNIKEPHPNDVLYGRGGGTNHHPGNKRYRKMVEERKVDYVNCKRLDKPLVALSIIKEWRGQLPPGRFLKMDDKSGCWNDVGDKKAREKTSQALREKAPLIRQELERERIAKERVEKGLPAEDEESKTTRFAAGTNMDKKPGIVARDHSLGVDYVSEEGVSLENFTWLKDSGGGDVPDRVSSQGSFNNVPFAYPPSRVGSSSSHTFVMSVAGGPPPPMPPPGGPYEHVTSGQSAQRFASWGSHQHQRFESWGSAVVPPPPPYGYPPAHTASWAREHSLSQNPLPHASCSQAAYAVGFEQQQRNNSGQWGGPPASYRHEGPPPPQYHQGPRQGSYGPPPPQDYGNGPPPGHHPAHPPSPPYTVDPAVASQWSNTVPAQQQSVQASLSAEEQRDNFNMTPPTFQKPTVQAGQGVPKPDMVKRATSNQNETTETRPDLVDGRVKRVALNREGSTASNRLKEKCMPGYFKNQMERITSTLEQSTLVENASSLRPLPITAEGRIATLDMHALDMALRPAPMSSQGRVTTMEALALEDPKGLEDLFVQEGNDDQISRPHTLTGNLRMTTTDMRDIVNEPLAEV